MVKRGGFSNPLLNSNYAMLILFGVVLFACIIGAIGWGIKENFQANRPSPTPARPSPTPARPSQVVPSVPRPPPPPTPINSNCANWRANARNPQLSNTVRNANTISANAARCPP